MEGRARRKVNRGADTAVGYDDLLLLLVVLLLVVLLLVRLSASEKL